MINGIKQFRTLIEVVDYFKDQETCKKFLEEMRWGKVIVCPHCKHENAYRTKVGYKCSSNKCYKKFSVITKTIFEGTKISLRKWFMTMFLLSNNNPSISSVSLAKQVGITQKSAWFLLHRLREVMVNKSNEKLSGVVEADEAMYGGKENKKPKSKRLPNNRGKGLIGITKSYIIGAVEQGGKIVTAVTDDNSKETLMPFLNKNVEKGSIIVTDAHTGYNPLPKYGYRHIANKHSKYKFTRVVDGITYHTQTIEGFWAIFKCAVLGTHRYLSRKHLAKYVAERTHRYNMRNKTSQECFVGLMGLIENSRITYQQLIKR